MLSPAQNKVYRPLVERAWRLASEKSGGNPADRVAREAWYRKTLLGGTGFYTTREVQSAEDFDSVMLCFARLAGDEFWVRRLAESEERRARWRLGKTMELAGVGSAYVEGIRKRMGCAEGRMEDLPAQTVLKINAALYLHAIRRKRA